MTQTTQKQSPLDREPYLGFIKEQVNLGESNAAIVTALALQPFKLVTTKDSIRRFRKRHGLQPPSKDRAGYRIKGDDAEVTTPAIAGVVLDDPDKMIEDRGLSPEDWLMDDITINQWDGPGTEGKVTYHQAKIRLKRKQPQLILPARSDGWKRPIKFANLDKSTQLIVVVGDQQAPFHDEELHAAFCGWLEQNEPDEGISLGDTIDLPDISRHRLDPENSATVNECVQSGHDLLKDYVGSSPATQWRKLAGNHDERLRNILLDKPSVQPLYGLKQADGEDAGQVAMSVRFLLRLDELGIRFEDPQGAYDLGQIKVNKNLAVRHGWIARAGSGASALATLDHLGYSVIVGHTHRQSIVYKTTHDIDGAITTLTAAEAGCMCRVNQQPLKGRKWPNFTPLPDWQQGFSTITVHPETGYFRIENATFVNGTLLWRDQCYKA